MPFPRQLAGVREELDYPRSIITDWGNSSLVGFPTAWIITPVGRRITATDARTGDLRAGDKVRVDLARNSSSALTMCLLA